MGTEDKCFVAFLLCVIALIAYAVYSCIGGEEQLKDCYMQNPKTEECSYMLWKYENRSKNSTTAVAIPVVGRL